MKDNTYDVAVIVREFYFLSYIQDSLQNQEKGEAERGAVVMAGRHYENRKRELEQSAHSRQERLRARQRQGGLCVNDEYNTLYEKFISVVSQATSVLYT